MTRRIAAPSTGRLLDTEVTASPENQATRRQLMEYERVFDTNGILLVDADAKTIRRVSFP